MLRQARRTFADLSGVRDTEIGVAIFSILLHPVSKHVWCEFGYPFGPEDAAHKGQLRLGQSGEQLTPWARILWFRRFPESEPGRHH
jgi:hypothetical protein